MCVYKYDEKILHANRAFVQANDAAACLKDLADKGARGVNCGIGENQYEIQMCRIGNAQVVSSKSTSSAQGANWLVEKAPHPLKSSALPFLGA